MFNGISSAIYKQIYTLRVCKSEILIVLQCSVLKNCSRISCWTKYENKHNVMTLRWNPQCCITLSTKVVTM